MPIAKKDFIEIEFTGRVKGGRVFDSNIKKDLSEASLNFPAKPFTFCIGENMFLPGIEEFLIGKEVGESYNIELDPEKAFGKRDAKFVKMIPKKVFDMHKINPLPGAMLNFDNQVGKVLTVSGGRVIVDFNNPLAGKFVVYDVKVLKKIEDLNEKIKSFIEYIFKRELNFSIVEKKLVIESEKEFMPILGLFKDKFKEVFDLDLETKELAKLEVKEVPK